MSAKGMNSCLPPPQIVKYPYSEKTQNVYLGLGLEPRGITINASLVVLVHKLTLLTLPHCAFGSPPHLQIYRLACVSNEK